MKYFELIQALAKELVKGMEEHARDMNEDPAKLPEDEAFTAHNLFEAQGKQMLQDGLLEDVLDAMRDILYPKPKVEIACTLTEENYDMLLDILHIVQKDSRKADDEAGARAAGEIADAISGGRK